jgi:hypothetical protein
MHSHDIYFCSRPSLSPSSLIPVSILSMADPTPIIKKRSRPHARTRQASPEASSDPDPIPENEEEAGLP